MRALIWVLLTLIASAVQAAPLTPYQSLSQGFRSQLNNSGWYVKGSGSETWYPLEVDPSTGAIPVSGNFSVAPSLLLEDHGYGTVSQTNTLRTASQIGSATGAADFGNGAVSAQTLRTVSVLSNGSSTAAFGAGATTAATLRAVLATDQTALPVNNYAAVTTAAPSYATGTNQPLSLTTAGGLRVDGSAVTQPVSATSLPLPTGAATAAKQPALGTAGTPSADVLSIQGVVGGVAQNVSGTVTANTQGAVTTAAPTYATGTSQALSLTTAGAVRTDSSATTQPISGTVTANLGTTGSVATGTNVTETHQSTTAGTAATKAELIGGIYNSTLPTLTSGQGAALQTDSSGRIIVSPTPTPISGKAAALLARYDYTSGAVTTAAYTQITASTSNAITKVYIFDSSGSAMIFAVGASGSEVPQLYVPPGGSGAGYELAIPAGSRIAVKALDANASVGQLVLTALN